MSRVFIYVSDFDCTVFSETLKKVKRALLVFFSQVRMSVRTIKEEDGRKEPLHIGSYRLHLTPLFRPSLCGREEWLDVALKKAHSLPSPTLKDDST